MEKEGLKSGRWSEKVWDLQMTHEKVRHGLVGVFANVTARLLNFQLSSLKIIIKILIVLLVCSRKCMEYRVDEKFWNKEAITLDWTITGALGLEAVLFLFFDRDFSQFCEQRSYSALELSSGYKIQTTCVVGGGMWRGGTARACFKFWEDDTLKSHACGMFQCLGRLDTAVLHQENLIILESTLVLDGHESGDGGSIINTLHPLG